MSNRSEKIIPINASTDDNTVDAGQPVDIEYRSLHNDNNEGDGTMDNLANSLKKSHQADINSVKNSLTQTNLKISIITGVIISIGVPIVTAVLLKFLHLS